MRRTFAIYAGTAACLAALAACNSLLGISEREPFPPDAEADGGQPADATTEDAAGLDDTGDASQSDAGANDSAGDGGGSASDSDASAGDASDASAGDAGDSSGVEAGDADTGAPPCSGPIVYVSNTTGKDTYPGCSTSAPKQTIAAGLALAFANGASAVEVCKGNYAETPLTLGFAASLEGGYDCVSFQRTPTYGYPSFDGTNETVVTNVDPSSSPNTLTVSGIVVQGVEVDGLAIQGAATGTTAGPATAVLVANSATPSISNNQLTGGAATSTSGYGSVGLYLTSGAAPLVQGNQIGGGSGTPAAGESFASIGLYADGSNGSVTISGNVIDGGSGTALLGTGSTGVKLDATGTTPLDYTVTDNTVTGGTGTCGVGAVGCAVTQGVTIKGNSSVTLQGNSVEGGGGATGDRCGTAVGITGSAGPTTIANNRIHAPKCRISTVGTNAGLNGLFISDVGLQLEIIDNMISGGTSTANVGGPALSVGGASAGPIIRHNTLIGPSALGAGIALLLEVGSVGTQPSNAVVENNIVVLVSSDSSGEAVNLACPTDGGAPLIRSFQNNVVLGTSPGATLMRYVGCGLGAFTTIDAMTAEMQATQPGATIAANLTMAPSCGTDSGCIVSSGCSSATACLPVLFAGWDSASLGVANLLPSGHFFTGTCPPSMPTGTPVPGWPLAATAPCAVVRSSLNDTATVPTDLYGNCRTQTSTPSMGAAESAADRADAGAEAGGCQ